ESGGAAAVQFFAAFGGAGGERSQEGHSRLALGSDGNGEALPDLCKGRSTQYQIVQRAAEKQAPAAHGTGAAADGQKGKDRSKLGRFRCGTGRRDRRAPR